MQHLRLLLSIALLLGICALICLGQYYVCGNWQQVWEGMLGNIAFIPIELLLVTLVLQHLLERHGRHSKRQTLNMTIGVFFFEIGVEFLRHCCRLEKGGQHKDLRINASWTVGQFRQIRHKYLNATLLLTASADDLLPLQQLLLSQRNFLLTQMQNPNLMEQEYFTDMLWAMFHLTDEMAWRGELRQLAAADLTHLLDDITRAYRLVLLVWLDYMRHLQRSYPYLFGLALRHNPFAAKKTAKKKRRKTRPESE